VRYEQSGADFLGSCCSLFPEVFETAAELAASESIEGVGSGKGPVHAGALESGSDRHLPACLDDAGRDGQALRPKLRAAHAALVAAAVVRALAGLLVGSGMKAQPFQEGVRLAIVQFAVSLLGPPEILLRRPLLCEAV